MISDEELQVLSMYRAGELAGALFLGKLALHTTIDKIRVNITQHAMEEAVHSWLWTKAIVGMGGIPLKETNSYQAEYGRVFGMPQDIIDAFCLTQVLEKRVKFHFQRHLKLPNQNKIVIKTLKKLLADEEGHLYWIRKELDGYSREHGGERVNQTMKRCEEIDEEVYNKFMAMPLFKNYFKL